VIAQREKRLRFVLLPFFFTQFSHFAPEMVAEVNSSYPDLKGAHNAKKAATGGNYRLRHLFPAHA